jgi:polyisoprenoid-binding protein YceI
VNKYSILPERSTLWAQARSSLHRIGVETSGLQGFIEIDLAAENPVTGHIDLDAARIRTGNPLYDRELKRHLEARLHPRIEGAAIASSHAGGDRYHLRGNLSFHGVTRTLEGDVSLRAGGNDTIEIEGTTVIDVRNFGLQPPRLLMLRVYPDVQVRIRLLAQSC